MKPWFWVRIAHYSINLYILSICSYLFLSNTRYSFVKEQLKTLFVLRCPNTRATILQTHSYSSDFLLEALLGNVLQNVFVQGTQVGPSDGVELSTAQFVSLVTQILRDDAFSLDNKETFIHENHTSIYAHTHTHDTVYFVCSPELGPTARSARPLKQRVCRSEWYSTCWCPP